MRCPSYNLVHGLLVIVLVGCDGPSPVDGLVPNPTPTGLETATSPELSSETVSKIEKFCGDCHPLPIPSTFPKADWPREVQQGYDFYIDSKRTDLEEPLIRDVVRYFQNAAPEKLVVPRADQLSSTESPVVFQSTSGLGIDTTPPATAHVRWSHELNTLFFTDMRKGSLSAWTPSREPSVGILEGKQRLITTGRNICRVHLLDWDSDGLQDYLVGELGSFPVGDHQNGRVTMHFGKEDGGVESVVFADSLSRVIEAKPFDYDDDGDLDILVVEFGWRKTGSLKLLRRIGGESRKPEFEVQTLDSRHGPLGIEIADMDRDGKLDYVVAYGQEIETVEVYYHRGNENFEKQIVTTLIDPSYNSSSFQIVDMDQDGRLDIVHTCGDTMDAVIAKPYHGLRWIRNLGDQRWEERDLGLLVGALQSTVADFDGDGDLDIAAVGLFPKAHLDGKGAYDSICWWEQKEHLQFIRHSIERDDCSHATCTAADVNADGRIDLVVGQWLSDDKTAFRLFLNQGMRTANR